MSTTANSSDKDSACLGLEISSLKTYTELGFFFREIIYGKITIMTIIP